MSELAKAIAFICYINRDAWAYYDLEEVLDRGANHVMKIGLNPSPTMIGKLNWQKWAYDWEHYVPPVARKEMWKYLDV